MERNNWNVVMRPRDWDAIIGQRQVVDMFRAMIGMGSFPAFSILGGPPGVGKSVIAELVGKSLTCSNRDMAPCGECANCKAFDAGRSMHVVKYDMPNIGEDEIETVLTNIFKVDSTQKVFILEEAHVMHRERIQSRFLEGTTKIPDNIYIIMCTTRPYSIIPALRNRASLYMLETPSDEECLELIKAASVRFGFDLPSQEVLDYFIHINRNSPRGILQALESLTLSNSMADDVLRSYFKMQGLSLFSKVFCALIDDSLTVYDFVRLINSDKEIDSVQIMNGLKDFTLSVLLELSLGTRQAIPLEAKKRIQELLKKGDAVLLKITDFLGGVTTTYLSAADAQFKLINLKLKLLQLDSRQIIAGNGGAAAEARMRSLQNTKISEHAEAIRTIGSEGFIKSRSDLKGKI